MAVLQCRTPSGQTLHLDPAEIVGLVSMPPVGAPPSWTPMLRLRFGQYQDIHPDDYAAVLKAWLTFKGVAQ